MPHLEKLKNNVTLMAETYYLFGIQKVCSLIFCTVSLKEMIGAVLRLLEIANLAEAMKVLAPILFSNPA
jgi:hypothetical protein